MSRLKIDFETEDTNVVCELADMLRRLHGREGHECGRQPVGPFNQSLPVTAEELGFTNGLLPPNPFAAGIQLGEVMLPPGPFALDPSTPPGSLVHPGELLPPPPMQSAGFEHAMSPAPPAPGVELDADGLPWDARIHSSSKGKLAKTGTWKLARNLDPALAASVTAELKAAMALPAPAARQPVFTAPIPEHPVMPPTPPAPHLSVVPPPPVPQPTAVTPPLAAPTAPGAMTFPAFLVEITKQQAAKKLTFDEVMVVLKEHGLENLQLLTARPDLIPSVYSRLEAVWTSR